MFKEIIFYLYTRVKKKLGPIYIHMFKEIRSYLYTRVE